LVVMVGYNKISSLRMPDKRKRKESSTLHVQGLCGRWNRRKWSGRLVHIDVIRSRQIIEKSLFSQSVFLVLLTQTFITTGSLRKY